MTIKRIYLVAFVCEADNENDVPTNVGFIEGIKDGLPDEWFEAGDDSFRIDRIVTDADWSLPPEFDPFPVGTSATVTDFDGSILGPFEVVRSYWPSPCVELFTPDGLVRQNHDRMKRAS